MVAIAKYLHRDPSRKPFLFATGIECSYPMITGKEGRDLRVDEYARTGHYDRWQEDFHLVKDMGVVVLRYGPPYYRVHLGPGKYDWSFVDETFGRLKELGIAPVADLCHFGLPEWLGNFQNPDWPHYFAEYARDFALRYPWVSLFTPVNEIFIAAQFSALYGWWNERMKSDRSFVTALKHMVRANLMAEESILKVTSDAVFVQSEATSFFHAETPAAIQRAQFFNQRRYLSLDLCYGVDVAAAMYRYLTDNGMTRQEYEWFMEHGRRMISACVMGNDYYVTNEHMVPEEGDPYQAGEVYGYYVITREYFLRYKLPVMHTETNNLGDIESVRWLRNMWLNMLKLKEDGVPIVGFTWYGLLDQVDWDTALREDNGHVDPLGLYTLDRKIRPVGEAYRKLIAEWKGLVPLLSRQLDVHALDAPPPPGHQEIWRRALEKEEGEAGVRGSAARAKMKPRRTRGDSQRT